MGVSIQDAAAQALATVERMRSLLAHSAEPPAVSGPSLELAAQAATRAAAHVSTLSSELAEQHHAVVTGAGEMLMANHRADTVLDQQLREAAAATDRARGQLDAIAARTRSLAQAAVTARTPADERALLGALRAEVAQASSVLDATHRQAGAIAEQIRTVDYHPSHD